MSVYISGMELSKVCDDCWALDDNYDYPRCRITDEQRGYNFNCRERRMDRCPLVPVPDHGRLIDADALMPNAQYKGKYDVVNAWDIANAPTIIPADKDGA